MDDCQRTGGHASFFQWNKTLMEDCTLKEGGPWFHSRKPLTLLESFMAAPILSALMKDGFCSTGIKGRRINYLFICLFSSQPPFSRSYFTKIFIYRVSLQGKVSDLRRWCVATGILELFDRCLLEIDT